MTNRRSFLKTVGAVAAIPLLQRFPGLFAEESQKSYKLSICDWNVYGHAAKPTAFSVAKELGFQGVQVSYQPDGEFSLSQKENCQLFLEEARKAEMGISSLALGILNGRPLATDPDAEGWVSDCMDAMIAMNAKNVLMAFFSGGELKDKPDAQKSVVEKLKRLAPKAEKHGLTLSIESYLNAEEHLRMLDAIGSDAIKVYYDFQNMANMGYDIFEDMPVLGKKNLISEVHLKDDTHRLEDSPLNYPKIHDALEKVGYRGWVTVESAVVGDWKESQRANAAYAKKIFQIN